MLTASAPNRGPRRAWRKCLIAAGLGLFTTASGFEIEVTWDAPERLRIGFPAEASSYHYVEAAQAVSGPWSVVAVLPGTQGTLAWTGPYPRTSGLASSYFRVRRLPRNSPRDLDKDGMDDLYELKWNFLNPLDPSDARQDQDQDGLLNMGEYQLGTDPTAQDSDRDWAFDGYEVAKGTDPRNPASAPPLEFRIDDNALYTSNATVRLDFGPFVSEAVALSEQPDMSGARTFPFKRRMDYTFADQHNGWRGLYLQYLANGGQVRSSIVLAGIQLDTIPPVLTVGTSTTDRATSVPLVDLEGRVEDSTPVVVTVNDRRVDGILGQRFVRRDQPLSRGTNTFLVVATDAAGNRATARLEYLLDTSGDQRPPGLDLDLPFDQMITGGQTNQQDRTTLGDEELLRVHAWTDELGVTASFMVTNAAETNGPYQGVVSGTNIWGRVVLFPGTNRLVCVVADAASNRTVVSRTVLRDTNLLFRITSPRDLAVLDASSVVVSGAASSRLRGARFSVNGVPANVGDAEGGLRFITTAPVPLQVGLTPLVAVAVLDGRTVYADPQVAGYQVVRWQHQYRHTYAGIEPAEGGYWYSDYTWTRDEDWSAVTRIHTEEHAQHLLDTFFWATGASEHTEKHNNTSSQELRENARTTAYFGEDDVQDLYTAYGLPGWDHDHLTLDDRLTFVYQADSPAAQKIILQFEDLGYSAEAGSPPTLDPTAVEFWGQRGFWCNGRASFTVSIEPFREYTISAGDFKWPTFRSRGPRPDMQDFYTEADVSSVRHVLQFSGLQSQPEPMEWLEGRHGFWLKPWAAVWCKLDLGPGLVSSTVTTAFRGPRVRVADFVEQTVTPGVEGASYSAGINGGFFFYDPLDLTCDADCLALQGFVGTGTSPWACGNPTRELPNGGNRWGFGLSGTGPFHGIEHDLDTGSSYLPGLEIQSMPYGMNNVGLLFLAGAAQRDASWAAVDEDRARSLMVWSRDGRDLFLVVFAFDNLLSGATWDETVQFLKTSFLQAVRIRRPLFEIGDAVMLDGGTSTQLSFVRRVGDPDRGNPIERKSWPSPLAKCVPTLVHASAVLPGR